MTLQKILGAAALTLVITAAYAASTIGPADNAPAPQAAAKAPAAPTGAPDAGGG